MKKEVLMFSFLFVLLIGMFFVSAEFTEAEEKKKINEAYECLDDVIEAKGCSSMTIEEKIFSLLATGECSDYFEDTYDTLPCWPRSDCDIKITAQVVLGLDKKGKNTDDAEAWLLEQTMIPDNFVWYLEIDGENEMDCTVNDGSDEQDIFIGEDKKIKGGVGSCFEKSPGDYWLEIDEDCYEEEFVTSCDKRFITTLLYKEKIGSIEIDTPLNVLYETHVAGTDGETTEQIRAICFENDGECDYEGSLWATLVLDYLDYNVSKDSLPYLIGGAEENERLLPESFLYFLTNLDTYRTDLLDKQINREFWTESGDKYYDTALALYPFGYEEELEEKINSKAWLLNEVQGEDGCWDGGNIKSTGFILYSIWPRGSYGGGDVDFDDDGCEVSGGYCMSSADCEGNILDSLSSSCYGMFVCCDTPKKIETCSEKGGEICNYNEECSVRTTSLDSGEKCCLGTCITKITNTCTQNSGICESSWCDEGYISTSDFDCENPSDYCCVEKEPPKSKIWIWILVILIVLTIVGIIFRDKLSLFFMKMKSKFGKGPGRGNIGPRGPRSSPPGYSRSPGPPMQRKMIPQTIPHRNAPPRNFGRPRPRAPRELDNVLKKLKDMSK